PHSDCRRSGDFLVVRQHIILGALCAHGNINGATRNAASTDCDFLTDCIALAWSIDNRSIRRGASADDIDRGRGFRGRSPSSIVAETSDYAQLSGFAAFNDILAAVTSAFTLHFGHGNI